MELKECKICGHSFKKLSSHIKLIHKIDPQLYYNRFILNIESDPLCEIKDCNKVVPFVKFSYGYRRFCSSSCSSIDRNKNPKLRKAASDRFKNLHNNKIFKEEHSIRCSKRMKKSSSEYHRLNFLSYCKSHNIEEAIFYIKEYSNYIKIGITSNSDNFKSKLKLKSLISYDLYIGKINEIADLELFIKSNFIPVKGAEYFNKGIKLLIEKSIPKSILKLPKKTKLTVLVGMSGAGKSTIAKNNYNPRYVLPDTNVKVYDIYNKLFKFPALDQNLEPDKLTGLTLWSTKYSADMAYIESVKNFTKFEGNFLNMRSGWDFYIYDILWKKRDIIPMDEMQKLVQEVESQFDEVEYKVLVMRDKKIIEELMSRNDDRSNLFNNDPIIYNEWQDFFVSKYEEILTKFNYTYTIEEVIYT